MAATVVAVVAMVAARAVMKVVATVVVTVAVKEVAVKEGGREGGGGEDGGEGGALERAEVHASTNCTAIQRPRWLRFHFATQSAVKQRSRAIQSAPPQTRKTPPHTVLVSY